MNTKMILPATIAAGLHAMVLSYRGSPAAPTPPTAPAPLEVIEFVPIPPMVEEPATIDRHEVEDLTPPPPDVPRQQDLSTQVTVDPGVITIPHVPVPPSFGPSTSVIPSRWSPGGSPDAPITIDGLDRIPRALMRHAPPTPPGFAGTATVTVDFIVGKDGRVQHVQIVDSTDSHLDDTCLRTVRRWRFEPGLRHNLPVAFRMQQTFVFTTRD